MTLAPIWRTRLYAAGGCLVAIWTGFAVAQEDLAVPFLLVGIAGLLLMQLQPLPVGSVFLGLILTGYIVGNRGFAQLYLANSLPLLPAELVLLVGGVAMVVQSAFAHEVPLRRDALNFAIFAWMVAGTVRVVFDVRAFGFAALRDYALVYYAGFFFLAQYAGRRSDALRFLHCCLLVGCGALLVIHPLAMQFPEFFMQLAVRGVPLIYFKNDLAGNFMALGSVLFYVEYERSRKGWLLFASLALAGLMLTTNSRSSMVGLALGALWLLLGGRWRFTAWLGAGAALAAAGILIVAEVRDQPWQQTALNGVYERAVSIVDPHGLRTYQDEDNLSKGDNNTFRMVWWKIAINEALDNNPWLGLGFGYDLAERFVQEYLPGGGEDFSARSPHNVMITIFSRMGAIGLSAMSAVLFVMIARTWKALHRSGGDLRPAGLWCGAWVIFFCACFGVVLEGPMGAVVFWTLLGLASAAQPAALQPTEPAGEAAAAP
jgi:O-antigen ligase